MTPPPSISPPRSAVGESSRPTKSSPTPRSAKGATRELAPGPRAGAGRAFAGRRGRNRGRSGRLRLAGDRQRMPEAFWARADLQRLDPQGADRARGEACQLRPDPWRAPRRSPDPCPSRSTRYLLPLSPLRWRSRYLRQAIGATTTSRRLTNAPMLPSSGTFACFCPACSRRNRPRARPAYRTQALSALFVRSSSTYLRLSAAAFRDTPTGSRAQNGPKCVRWATEGYKIARSAPFPAGR